MERADRSAVYRGYRPIGGRVLGKSTRWRNAQNSIQPKKHVALRPSAIAIEDHCSVNTIRGSRDGKGAGSGYCYFLGGKAAFTDSSLIPQKIAIDQHGTSVGNAAAVEGYVACDRNIGQPPDRTCGDAQASDGLACVVDGQSASLNKAFVERIGAGIQNQFSEGGANTGTTHRTAGLGASPRSNFEFGSGGKVDLSI